MFYFQSFATIDGLYQTTYEEELEINDFPQSCRWKVTSREAIGNITDYSEADIQIRGVYYPPGKEPGEGEERKLFHLITGRVFNGCSDLILEVLCQNPDQVKPNCPFKRPRAKLRALSKKSLPDYRLLIKRQRSAVSKWPKFRFILYVFTVHSTATMTTCKTSKVTILLL